MISFTLVPISVSVRLRPPTCASMDGFTVDLDRIQSSIEQKRLPVPLTIRFGVGTPVCHLACQRYLDLFHGLNQSLTL